MNKGWMTFAVVAAAGLVQAAMQPIAGTNVVGFAEISAPAAKNTIIAVPFEACMQAGVSGKLSDLVSTYGLTASDVPAQADQLVVLTTNQSDAVYYYYYNDVETGWTAINTEQLMPDGTKKTLTPPAASAFDVSRGQGFWIKRIAGDGSSVYVQGQVSGTKQSTTIGTGLNLISYSAMQSFTLNDPNIDWTGAYGGTGNTVTSDKILVSNGDGTYAEYYYFTKPAGWPEAYNTLHNKWITKSYTVASGAIAVGNGFWYYRRGAESFIFQPDGK